VSLRNRLAQLERLTQPAGPALPSYVITDDAGIIIRGPEEATPWRGRHVNDLPESQPCKVYVNFDPREALGPPPTAGGSRP
jgi:hypothetical protein